MLGKEQFRHTVSEMNIFRSRSSDVGIEKGGTAPLIFTMYDGLHFQHRWADYFCSKDSTVNQDVGVSWYQRK